MCDKYWWQIDMYVFHHFEFVKFFSHLVFEKKTLSPLNVSGCWGILIAGAAFSPQCGGVNRVHWQTQLYNRAVLWRKWDEGTATKVAEKYDGTQSLSHVGKVQFWPPDQKATENSHKVPFSTTVQRKSHDKMENTHVTFDYRQRKNCIFCIDVFLHCIETEVLKLFCLLSLLRLWPRPSKRQKSNIPICRWQRLLSTRKQRLAQISPD